jgi:hypothetical protein
MFGRRDTFTRRVSKTKKRTKSSKQGLQNFRPVISDHDPVEIKYDMRGMLRRRLDLLASSSARKEVGMSMDEHVMRSCISLSPGGKVRDPNKLRVKQGISTQHKAGSRGKHNTNIAPLPTKRIVIAPLRPYHKNVHKEKVFSAYHRSLKESLMGHEGELLELQDSERQSTIHLKQKHQNSNGDDLKSLASEKRASMTSREVWIDRNTSGPPKPSARVRIQRNFRSSNKKAPHSHSSSVPKKQSELLEDIDKAYLLYKSQDTTRIKNPNLTHAESKGLLRRRMSTVIRRKSRVNSSDSNKTQTQVTKGFSLNFSRRGTLSATSFPALPTLKKTSHAEMQRSTHILPVLKRSFSDGNLTNEDITLYYKGLEILRDKVVEELQHAKIPIRKDVVSLGLGISPERWYMPTKEIPKEEAPLIQRLPLHWNKQQQRRYWLSMRQKMRNRSGIDTPQGPIARGMFSFKCDEDYLEAYPLKKFTVTHLSDSDSSDASAYDEEPEPIKKEKMTDIQRIIEEAVPRVESCWTYKEVKMIRQRVRERLFAMNQDDTIIFRSRSASATPTVTSVFQLTKHERKQANSFPYMYWLDGAIRDIEYLQLD